MDIATVVSIVGIVVAAAVVLYVAWSQGVFRRPKLHVGFPNPDTSFVYVGIPQTSCEWIQFDLPVWIESRGSAPAKQVFLQIAYDKQLDIRQISEFPQPTADDWFSQHFIEILPQLKPNEVDNTRVVASKIRCLARMENGRELARLLLSRETKPTAGKPPKDASLQGVKTEQTKAVVYTLLVVGVVAAVGYGIWTYVDGDEPPDTVVYMVLAFAVVAAIGYGIWLRYAGGDGGRNQRPERDLRMIAIDIATGIKHTLNETTLLVRQSVQIPKEADFAKLINDYSVSPETVEGFKDANGKGGNISNADLASNNILVRQDDMPNSLENWTRDDLGILWEEHNEAEIVIEMSQFGWSGDEGLLYVGSIRKSSRTGRGNFFVFRRYGSQYSCESLPYLWLFPN